LKQKQKQKIHLFVQQLDEIKKKISFVVLSIFKEYSPTNSQEKFSFLRNSNDFEFENGFIFTHSLQKKKKHQN
jgi:hypothetical protein